MNRQLRIAVSISFTVSMATGCSITKAIERPIYQGIDQIGTVEVASIVGKWRVIDLNPHPDAQTQETMIEYRADGTVTGEVNMSGDDMSTALGNTSLQLTGNWTLQDGVLSHTDISMTSLDRNATGSLLSQLINHSSQELGGSANIQELSAERMVMLGSDGAAMEYIRVR